VLERQPDRVEAMMNLATILANNGGIEEAVRLSERVLTLTPGKAIAWSNLGNHLAMAGRVEDGIPKLRKALALDPRFGRAHAGLTRWLIESEPLVALAHAYEWVRVEPAFEAAAKPVIQILEGRILQASPDHPLTLAIQARIALRKDREEAQDLFDQAKAPLATLADGSTGDDAFSLKRSVVLILHSLAPALDLAAEAASLAAESRRLEASLPPDSAPAPSPR
jgi:tetratricopeptide (TPR) repeat protein